MKPFDANNNEAIQPPSLKKHKKTNAIDEKQSSLTNFFSKKNKYN